MYGLCRIIQIDGFISTIRTVVELKGHSIINGTNGAGKSSTLKLLSFFYGNDPSQINSYAAGRETFVQFYLPRQTSLLVFEYTRESGLCCVVAYRHKNGTKHVYRFLDGSFSEERFSQRDISGKPVYCKGHDLKIHWQQLGLTCSKQIEVVTDYRAIIQNDMSLINRRAESKELRRLAASYCLGSSRTHMRYIERICAAIISRSGNMDRIKDMLADIMVEDGVIFPETPIHRDDAGLANEISSLMAFEKEVPYMKKVLERHYKRLEIETKLASYGGQVKQAKLDISDNIVRAKQELGDTLERIKQLQSKWESEYSSLSKQIIEAKNEVEACDGRIDRLHKQYDDYEGQDMNQKVSDFENLGRFMEEAEHVKDRYKRLIDEVREEENALNRSLNSEHEHYERIRDKTQLKLDAARENWKRKYEEHTLNIEEVFSRQRAEIDIARENASPNRGKIVDAKAIAQANAVAGGATEEERLSLADILQHTQKLENELLAVRADAEEKKNMLESVRNLRDNAAKALNQAKSSHRMKQDAREVLHKLAYAESGTWLSQLREKDSGWAERLGKIINPDLLQRNDLRVEYTEEEIETIFGWSVNLHAIATPQYAETEDQLRADYRAQEEVVRVAEELVSQRESNCEKANKQYKESEQVANTVQISLQQKSSQKEGADKSFHERRREVDDAIDERRIAAKKEVKRLEKEIKAFDEGFDKRIKDIKERQTEDIRELQGAWALEENQIKQEIDRLSQDLKTLSDNHKRNYSPPCICF